MTIRALILALFVVALGTTAEAAVTHEAILAAVASGDTAAAVEALERLEADDAATFRANNYDYLLGRLHEARGKVAAATARYTAVVGRGSNLAEYALWRLAALARAEGNFALERQHLDRLAARYPGSTLTTRAIVRAGRSAHDAGDWQLALARLQPRANTSGADARDALARVAVARMRLGDRVGARRDFARLLDGAQDDYALEAARGLDELDEAEKVASTEFDHVRRGRVYLNNRDWAGARTHFLAVADTPNAQNRAEALYTIGLTYYRVEEHDAAIDWWEKAAREFPQLEVGIKAALWIGHALQRSGRFDAAVSRYEAFIARYPNDEQVESAYRNAIDSLRSAGNVARALEWCTKAEAARPGSALATFAAFNRAKIRLTAGEPAVALAEFTRLRQSYNLRATGPGMPTAGEVDLLRAVCYERLGRLSEAVAAYLAIPAGRDAYFGNRATERLLAIGARPDGRATIDGALKAALAAARTAHLAGSAGAAKTAADRALRLTRDAALRGELLGILRDSYAALPAYARVTAERVEPIARAPLSAGRAGSTDRSHGALAAELAFLGLYDEASPELAASGFGTRAPRAMALYHARGSRGDIAVEIGERLSGGLPDDFRVELMPREVAELIYPAPYRDALRQAAAATNVDPRMTLSIARQESRFKPWVKSPAAARGLMQFIPETASRIAAAIGLARFDQDDLYDPNVAVRVGSRYLGDLFALFPDNPAAVAASYNGGEDNVARWARRAADPNDVDLVIAEVSFKETKTYVYRVMNNYWAYQALYTRELQNRER